MKPKNGTIEWVRIAVLVAIASSALVDSLKIAAFNVRVFGRTKAGKPEVMDILAQIISRYDIVLIQEIRDSSGAAIDDLLQLTNARNNATPFEMSISERLGRTSSKEQYAFFYRPTSGLTVVDSFTYDDGDENLNTANVTVDTFQREPYVVLFESTTTMVKRFAIAGIHVAPDEAVEEITALMDVFNDTRTRLGVDDVIVMGDFNADCTYVPTSRWPDIPLRCNRDYIWLIGDEVDTTVTSTDCAYDRIVVTGPGFDYLRDDGIVSGSAKAFKFDAYYGLNSTEALDVSDHYPVEMRLKLKIMLRGSARGCSSSVLHLALVCVFCLFQAVCG